MCLTLELIVLSHVRTGAALNYKSLINKKITHVINWSPSAKCNTFKDVEYMCITGISGRSDMLHRLDKLDQAVEFIANAIKAGDGGGGGGGRVMSHCWHGRNRRWGFKLFSLRICCRSPYI